MLSIKVGRSISVNVRTSMQRRIMKTDKKIQVKLQVDRKPSIRKGRKTNQEIWFVIATVSSWSRITVQKAYDAVQTVCEKLYNHKYYLKPCKASKTIANKQEVYGSGSKKTKVVEEHKQYRKVLPSAKSVNEFKHRKPLHQEI